MLLLPGWKGMVLSAASNGRFLSMPALSTSAHIAPSPGAAKA
jgi:hypothetical protein